MLFSRPELEERERRMLAPYGMKSADSQGREFPEDEPPDRTAFQRDRGWKNPVAVVSKIVPPWLG